jgi:hypothetical protein
MQTLCTQDVCRATSPRPLHVSMLPACVQAQAHAMQPGGRRAPPDQARAWQTLKMSTPQAVSLSSSMMSVGSSSVRLPFTARMMKCATWLQRIPEAVSGWRRWLAAEAADAVRGLSACCMAPLSNMLMLMLLMAAVEPLPASSLCWQLVILLFQEINTRAGCQARPTED